MDSIGIGYRFKANCGDYAEVIAYENSVNVTVRFDCGHERKTRTGDIRRGRVKNHNKKTIYGVGFIGAGEYKSRIDGELTKAYSVWSGIMQRCYDISCKAYSSGYSDCSVDSRWHNFQNFAAWHHDNYIYGYHLDKDLLVIGNRIYSEDTCIFVPQWVNNLFANSSTTGCRPKGDGYAAYYAANGKQIHAGMFDCQIEASAHARVMRCNHISEKINTSALDENIYEAVLRRLEYLKEGGVVSE